MRFHLISLFPSSFPGPLGQSVLGRGQKEGIFSLCLHDLRKFGQGSNLMVDDSPYGHRARALAIGHMSGLLAAVEELT